MPPHHALAYSILEAAPLAQLRVAADQCAHYTLWIANDEEIAGAVQCANSSTYYPSLFSNPDGSWSTECGCATATHGHICHHAVLLASAVLRDTPLRTTYSYTPALTA